MSRYLVVSALGENRQGFVRQITGLASQAGCNIIDSRMTELGGEFALMMLMSGEWNALAKMEHSLPALANKLGLITLTKRTTRAEDDTGMLPYRIQVVALDNPGIIHDMAIFFSEMGIVIVDLTSDTYQAPHTAAAMVVLTMTINVPGGSAIAELRDSFGQFTDQHNLDATLEPLRPGLHGS